VDSPNPHGGAVTETEQRESRTESSNRWPDFFIIGAAKAGTTTLQDYLARHPSLWMSSAKDPRCKEPRFFDPHAESELRDPNFYHWLFDGASEDQLCGEASTPYSEWPRVSDVPRSIHSVIPHARFIYLLREPLGRCHSHYVQRHSRQVLREQSRRLTFEEYLALDPSIADASDYASQIQRYLEYFPKESLLLLTFERLVKEPEWTLQRVFDFLGVEDLSETLTRQPIHSNSTNDVQTRMLRNRLFAPLRRVPGLRLTYRCLPPSLRAKSISLIEKSFFGRRAKRELTFSPMLPATRERLRERFDESTKYLVAEFGFDPSWWNREPAA